MSLGTRAPASHTTSYCINSKLKSKFCRAISVPPPPPLSPHKPPPMPSHLRTDSWARAGRCSPLARKMMLLLLLMLTLTLTLADTLHVRARRAPR